MTLGAEQALGGERRHSRIAAANISAIGSVGRLADAVVEIVERAAGPERLLELRWPGARRRRRRIVLSKMIAQLQNEASSSRIITTLTIESACRNRPQTDRSGASTALTRRSGRDRPGGLQPGRSAADRITGVAESYGVRCSAVRCVYTCASDMSSALQRNAARSAAGKRVGRAVAARRTASVHLELAPAIVAVAAHASASSSTDAPPSSATRGRDRQQVVEPRRRAGSRCCSGAPRRRRRAASISSAMGEAQAAQHLGARRARRTSDSWRDRRCRRRRCPRSRRGGLDAWRSVAGRLSHRPSPRAGRQQIELRAAARRRRAGRDGARPCAVSMRPRGVRCSRPCWIRNGSIDVLDACRAARRAPPPSSRRRPGRRRSCSAMQRR